MKLRLVSYVHFFGYAVFLLLAVVDIAEFFKLPLGKIGVVFWYWSFLFIVIFALKFLNELITDFLISKTPYTLLLLAFWIGIIVFNIPQPRNISGETTQEIACTLNHLHLSPDWGYKQTCLFGYPAKQYLIPALPSLLFPASLVSLNSGGSIYFILGLIIFSGGVLKYFHYSKSGNLINAILLSFILHLYWVNYFVFFFEQSNYPFGIGMIISGFFLYFLADKKSVPPYLFGYLLMYLIFSYTPSLGIYFLFLLILGYISVKDIKNKKINVSLLIVLVITLISFYISTTYRSDLKFINHETRSMNLLSEDFQKGLKTILWQKDGEVMYSPYFHLLFITIMFFSLFFLFGWKSALLALYIIAILLASILSEGYTYYAVNFRLHRASVIFPILFLTIAINLQKFNLSRRSRYLYAVLLLFLFSGIIYQSDIINQKKVHPYYSLIRELQALESNPKSINKNKTVYFSRKVKENYVSLNDLAAYFLPDLIFISNKGNDCPANIQGYLVIEKDNPCYYTGMINGQLLSEYSSDFGQTGIFRP